jgi:hypothetical protein
VSIKELAEWFGLEIARLVVDECLVPRETGEELPAEAQRQRLRNTKAESQLQ